MELYHFTANRFIPTIKTQGIIHGRILKTINPLTFLCNYQWLTKNKSFDQEWAIGTGILPYKRNEVRITVNIPKESEKNISSWDRIKFMVPEVSEVLSCRGDPENWMLYEGKIEPGWLTEITPNKGVVSL